MSVMKEIHGVFKIPTYTFNDYIIPSLELYLFEGITPGGNLTALLCGDLYMASMRADHFNKPLMADHAKWIYLNFPNGSFGNWDNFNNWCKNANNIRSTWAEKVKTEHMWEILQGAV